MASRILGMGDVMTLIEKAEAQIDEEKAAELGKKFKNNSCNIQNNVYAPTGMNIPKKLRETFRGYINTFFSPITPVYNHKVINFALYQQGVERVL